MGTKDSTLARLIKIIANYFTPRRRSRNGRNTTDDDDEYPEGGDGEACGSDDDEKPDSSLAEASGLEATTGDGVGAEELESCECTDDDDAFEHERLAYFLGGTPRPTPTKGSPWSPGIEAKPEETKPELKTTDDVQEALQKLESLDQNNEIHIQFVSSN